MEFQEVMSPMTTPTTCYSGARNGECNTIRLATESNLLGVHIDYKHGIKRVSSEAIRSNFICVGHSQWDNDHNTSVFLNPSRLPVESDEPTLSRPLDRDDADASVVSNSVPAGGASVVSTKSIGTDPQSKSNASSLNTESKSNENQSSSEPEKMDGRLVLTTPEAEYTAVLTGFRPLSPCLACWGDISMGVWLGSADDSQLRLYMPNRANGTLDLVMSLPSEVLAFKTSVLAIDFASTQSLEVLAVACQDGTIKLITWKGDAFEEMGFYQVIVDGPILTVRVQESLGTLNVFVGSLCGYVCLLSRTESHGPNQWDGPKMVVEGLHNQAIESADSVVVVNSFDNIIAVGTHGGRCILCTRIKNRYVKVWECQLPYSVHGILLQRDEDGDRLLLLATTRRSLHLFLKTNGKDFSKGNGLESEATYCAANVQNRLVALLKPEAPLHPEIVGEVEDSNNEVDEPENIQVEEPDQKDEESKNEAEDHSSHETSPEELVAMAKPEEEETAATSS
ncbi:unnamed protein product [Cylindrotheca closterium]|uniref:Uncharacterized protein n=1 Tax=Cylindrotheca closterium TaxID=2856 RepID=A0AAD2FJW1_9STRA|nr:unnamed protein product [Cylindrotheca closterium]